MIVVVVVVVPCLGIGAKRIAEAVQVIRREARNEARVEGERERGRGEEGRGREREGERNTCESSSGIEQRR